MPTYTENRPAEAAVASEANGTRSRETVTILSGQNLKAGAVLGRVTVGAATAQAFAGNTGNGAMGAITLGAGAKAGVYKLVVIEPATNAGRFTVEDPDGVIIGVGAVASAFSAGGLAFTLADGATDFVAGDGFDITVAAGSGKYKEYNPANTDGSQTAVAVLLAPVDASAADKSGVALVRSAEIVKDALVWFSGASANQKTTGLGQLALVGVIGR